MVTLCVTKPWRSNKSEKSPNEAVGVNFARGMCHQPLLRRASSMFRAGPATISAQNHQPLLRRFRYRI